MVMIIRGKVLNLGQKGAKKEKDEEEEGTHTRADL